MNIPVNDKKYFKMLYLLEGVEFNNDPISSGPLKQMQEEFSDDDQDFINENIEDWFTQINDSAYQFNKDFLEKIMED